ncbi:GGDEF domain-containing protein [Clostridium sp. 19966]|uniref:sensor domain-containing diguanylate cyclase n=1 Tax=Clostridium sp. 19966 TaxID=2768166 RepID=UPI0028DFAC07|nr:diguanylate cyclase [Clostridium sp. 19966]MDT8717812.1 GGDEF domain-containing protein [Clostridium sp. 19966]
MYDPGLDTHMVDILNKLDKIRYDNFENTISLSEEAYKLCKINNYEVGMALCLLRNAEGLLNLGQYTKSILKSYECIDLCQNNDICDLHVLARILIGNALFDLSNYEGSFDFYNSAIRLSHKLSKSKNYYASSCYEYYAARVFSNIAEIYRILGNLDLALNYYKDATLLDERLDFKATMGICLSNLGIANFLKENYDEAMNLVLRGIERMKHHNYYSSISESYKTLGLIYEKKLDFENAEKYFYEAINVDDKYGNTYYKIEALIDFGSFLRNRNKIQEALSQYTKALNLASKNNILDKCLIICKFISMAFEDLGDLQNSMKYFKLYFEYDDKNRSVNRHHTLEAIKAKAELRKLEIEKKKLVVESEHIKKRSESLLKTINNVSTINRLVRRITSTQDLKSIIKILCSNLQSLLKVNSLSLILYNKNTNELSYEYCIENGKAVYPNNIPLDGKASISSYSLINNKFIIINDMTSEYHNYVDDSKYILDNTHNLWLNSAIYAPMVLSNVPIGVLSVQSEKMEYFTDLHVEILKVIASYGAIAINNAIKSKDLNILNEKLLYMSENDSLTDIYNRRKFDVVIENQWKDCLKRKSPLSLIIFDVDYFKEYNDNYGHLEGDQCLVSIASKLVSISKKNFISARYGGDEFTIIMPDTDVEEALKFGELLVNEIRNLNIEHSFSKSSKTVTITAGAASMLPSEDSSPKTLMKHADLALYDAKSKGKNRIESFNKIM